MGNNRIVANASGSVVQSTQYYPFGMAFAESTNQGTQPYKYNGKELDQDHGLNWYDYEARYLTNDVPRFTTMDPLAEKYYSISPYVYCANNPIKFIDPTGMSYTYNWETGDYEHRDKNGKTKTASYDEAVNNSGAKTYDITTKQGRDNLQYDSTLSGVLDTITSALQGIFFSNEVTPSGDQHIKPKNLGPDYTAVSLSGTSVVGGGFGLDFNLGYVKGEGLFFNESFRMGDGFDISGSAAFTYGKYTGNGKPTATSLAGKAFYQNLGAGLITVGSFQDLSKSSRTSKYILGQNWIGGNLGISLGSKSFLGGSMGLSITSHPLFLNK